VKRYYSGERGRLDRFRRRPADGTAERDARQKRPGRSRSPESR